MTNALWGGTKTTTTAARTPTKWLTKCQLSESITMHRVHNVVTMIVTRAAGAPGEKTTAAVNRRRLYQIPSSETSQHFSQASAFRRVNTPFPTLFIGLPAVSLWRLKAANAAAVKCQLCNGNW